MMRVSTDMINNNMQYNLRRHESAMSDLEDKLASQERIKNLRDDPIAAAHAVKYQSYLTRLSRYEGNAQRTEDSYKVTEGYMRSSVDILQRIRELAVRGGQTTNTKEDMQAMGTEADELLKELVLLGNVRDGKGNMVFSGDKSKTEPFSITKGQIPGGLGETIVQVDYVGNSAKNMVEIQENGYMELNQPGNETFWAEKQELFSATDVAGFQVKEKSAFFIDGKKIEVDEGDNASVIIAKINDSEAAVRAHLDPVRNSVILQTTDAHQLMLEDEVGGSILKDLGILKDNTSPSPHNYAPSVRVSGGSMFDTVIRLRDSLFKGDSIEAGGQGLAGIDSAISSMTRRLSETGSRMERLQATQARYQKEIPDVTSQLSREADLDITTAITDLKMIEYANKASLQVAGRVLQQTLLDFLR